MAEDTNTSTGLTGSGVAPTATSADARDVPLALPADEFRRLGYRLVDQIGALLVDLGSRPVTTGESPADVKRQLDADAPLPAAPAPPDALLSRALSLLADHSLFNGHPRFFGYITASPAPIGILGDFLAAAVNANAGAWRLSPMASEMEGQTVRWIAQLLGYPDDGGGLFVSGGNMANIVGFLAARAAAGRDWEIRARGVGSRDAHPLAVYASVETHTWLQKAADLSGIGTEAIRWVPTDVDARLDVGALRTMLDDDRAAGVVPMLVVGTAGSVSTGVVDPLADIAAVCRDHGVWFHVDGAYGAPAAAVPGTPDDLRALHLADSLAVDPHKWLYAPLEAGCVLTRDAGVLRDAFSYHPPYYHFEDRDGVNYVDLGPQNSRGFKALKVWLMLQHAGADGYRRMIADDIALARRLYDAAAAHPELEACSHALSITTFRYVPADRAPHVGHPDTEGYLNALNEAVLERLQRSGTAFVSNAVVRGRYLLRACIVNINTRNKDVDELPRLVARVGADVHASGDVAPH